MTECCRAAVSAAEIAPEDPAFPGLPGPQPIEYRDRAHGATGALDAEGRARAVEAIVGQAAAHGLSAAGKVEVSDAAVAVANTKSVDAAMPVSEARATVLAMGDEGGSGWASFSSADPRDLVPEALGDEAASLALRSEDARSLEPGTYVVVLAHEAVAELLSMLAYAGFSAKAVAEGRSFMSGHLGEKVVSERITILDDAASPEAQGLTFDFEGMPKRRTPLIEDGVAVRPVTDSYWAAVTDTDDTGHALPAPNSFGPLPLDIEMAPGDGDIDRMVGSVERGIYVTRFHYVNVEDPMSVLLTGMTRDGTFMIEGGRLTHPVRNLRFTQSALGALDSVESVGADRRHVDAMLGSALAPARLVREFVYTGQPW